MARCLSDPIRSACLSPGKAVVGMIGGRAESARQWFKPGIPTGVGVISRSGGMASSTGYYLGQAGVRISTIAHIGGDAVLGIRIPDAALMFEADPLTEAIVIFGEIGSSQEEELAQLIRDRKVTKPVIAYIGGKAAREGTRFSHAGAIIEGGRGTHAGKVKALREAGATVVDAFGELPGAVVEILKRMKWTKSDERSRQERRLEHGGHAHRAEPRRRARIRHRRSDGTRIFRRRGVFDFDRRIAVACDRKVNGWDFGRVDRSRRDATERLVGANRRITGASLSAAVAAGIMSINRHHGGAIEDCARQLKKIADRADEVNPFRWMKRPRERSPR